MNKITIIDPGTRFAVHSSSGKTYEIRYAGFGSADPEYVSLWECNCPAGQRGLDCKHMKAFINSNIMYVGDLLYHDDKFPTEISF